LCLGTFHIYLCSFKFDFLLLNSIQEATKTSCPSFYSVEFVLSTKVSFFEFSVLNQKLVARLVVKTLFD
jgi:hypothetical protein